MHPCFSLNYCLMRKVSTQATFWNTSDSLWILKYLLRKDKLQLRHLWKNFVKIQFSSFRFGTQRKNRNLRARRLDLRFCKREKKNNVTTLKLTTILLGLLWRVLRLQLIKRNEMADGGTVAEEWKSERGLGRVGFVTWLDPTFTRFFTLHQYSAIYYRTLFY